MRTLAPALWRLLVAVGGSALLLLAAAAQSQARSVCLKDAELGIAKALQVGFGELLSSVGSGSNGMPQCVIRTRGLNHATPRTPVTLVINVDDGPQAAKRLGWQVEEATQIFGPSPPGWKPPQGLFGLGPNAAWYPNQHYLKASNQIDLITVTVSWRHARKAQQILLARGAITPYQRHRGDLVKGLPGTNPA